MRGNSSRRPAWGLFTEVCAWGQLCGICLAWGGPDQLRH